MRRIEPAFPDLIPLTHRLGWVPGGDGPVRLDPVEMRLCRGDAAGTGSPSLASISSRRPTRVLVHAGVAQRWREVVDRLVRAGNGILLVLDDVLEPENLPAPLMHGQTTVLAPWWPSFWGGGQLPDLEPWRRAGHLCGVLLGFAPAPNGLRQVQQVVADAAAAHAQFAVVLPLAVSPELRHQVYDLHAGDDGDQDLENLLFHSDWGRLTQRAEVAVSQACRAHNLTEGLGGPSTSVVDSATFALASGMLLWARRFDQLDGMASQGWQLRRAAHALMAAGRDAGPLMREDNLRLIPGFTPWVEAFSRALWTGNGEPFAQVLERWLGG